jgi:hypothetical protein
LGGLDESLRAVEKIARTLRIEEAAIKDLDIEAGVVVGRNGEVIQRISGAAHFVSVTPGIIKGNVFTHNHPGGICAFSEGDVIGFSVDEAYELRAVTRDGRFVSLRENSDIPRSASLADAFSSAGFNHLKLQFAADLRAIQKYGQGRTTEQVKTEAENIVNGWLTENAAKYGCEFTEGII